MPGIDASIPLGAKAPDINPLQTIGGLADVASKLNQNRLFGAEFGAKQAIAKAIAAHTDENGDVDYGAALADAARDPAARFGIQSMSSDALQQRIQQAGLAKADVDAYHSRFAVAADAVLPLLKLAPGKITPEAFDSAIGNVMKSGLFNDPKSVNGLVTIAGQLRPKVGPDGSVDDTGTRQGIQQFFIAHHANTEGLNTAFGAPMAVGTGGSTNIVRTGLGGVETQPGGVIPNTLSPETKASGVGVVGPDGATTREPLSQFVTDTGEARPGVAQPQVAQGPAAAAAQGVTGTTSATQLAQDRLSAANAQASLVPLRKVYDLLGEPGNTTGPGTQAINGWRSFVQSNLPALANLYPGGLDASKIATANADELKKYMVQIAGAQAAAYGPGTNEKLAVAASGNANPDLSNLANRDVTRMNIALTRAQQAKVAAFAQSGQPEQNYSAWVANWAKNTDPRAFMLDLLTKEQRQKLLGTINTDAEKRAFLAGKRAAEAAGLISEADIPR